MNQALRLRTVCIGLTVWVTLAEVHIGSAAAQTLATDLSTSDTANPGANGPGDDTTERTAWLTSSLCDLQRPARVYSYSWIGALSALLIAQTALSLTTDANDEAGRAARTGYVLGGSMTGLGLGLVALTSRPETNSCDVMRSYPSASHAGSMERLREGERRLLRVGRAAQRQTAWWMHGIGVLLGTGVALGLGLGYSDNVLRATLQGVGTVAFTELRIWTRPTRAIDYARRYEARQSTSAER